MKTLLVMRHAKSSRDDANMADSERPLNDRGRRDAPVMGRRLADAGQIPDAILSSSAVRARQTAMAVAEACGFQGSVRYLDELYAAPPPAYLLALASLPDDVAVALVVGHNPGVADLVHLLSGESREMPTAAIAHLRLAVEHWADLRTRGMAELVAVWRPKD